MTDCNAVALFPSASAADGEPNMEKTTGEPEVHSTDLRHAGIGETDAACAEAAGTDGCTTVPSVDWSRFDRIVCINYSPYAKRRRLMADELRRVGIYGLDSFEWKSTVTCPQYQILFDVMKKHGFTDCKSQVEFNIAMAHFEAIKSAYAAGCSSVLVMEDDVRFLKELGRVSEIFAATPDDYDVALYDSSPHTREELEAYRRTAVNPHFARYERLYSSGCYAVSRRGMGEIVRLNEEKLHISDTTPEFMDSSKFNRYFATGYPTCHVVFSECHSVVADGANSIHGVLSLKGVNYADYCIGDDSYGYGSVIAE